VAVQNVRRFGLPRTEICQNALEPSDGEYYRQSFSIRTAKDWNSDSVRRGSWLFGTAQESADQAHSSSSVWCSSVEPCRVPTNYPDPDLQLDTFTFSHTRVRQKCYGQQH